MQRTLTAIGLFLLVALGVSGGLLVIAGAAGVLGSSAGRIVVLTFYPVGPLAAAFVVQRWLRLPFTAEGFGVTLSPSPWLPRAWMLPLLIAGATLLIESFLPGVSLSFNPAMHLPALPPDATEEMKKQYEAAKNISPIAIILGQLGMALFIGALMNTIVALAEEVGWRGVLLRVLAVFGFWRSAVLTGVFVAIWSLPLVLLGGLYPNSPRQGLILVAVYALLMAPLLSFLRLASGTVVAAALFEGTLNSLARFVALFYLAGSDLLAGVYGLAGLIVLLAANVLIVIPRWRIAEAALRELAAATPLG